MNAAGIDRVRDALGRLLAATLTVAFGLLVFVVLWGVLSRGFGSMRAWADASLGLSLSFLPTGQSSWTEESARFLLVWVGFLGAALAFGRGGHLGVDYLMGKMAPEARGFAAVLSWICTLAFAGWVLLAGGSALVSRTMESGQLAPALGIAKGWVYLALPVAGAFSAVFAVLGILTVIVSSREASR
jgi:TRAP-type C4-dicarboxylate transport system permease small subunit